MLRHLARALRVVLLVAGIAIAAWLPLSAIVSISLLAPWPGHQGMMRIHQGRLDLIVQSGLTWSGAGPRLDIERLPPARRGISTPLWPTTWTIRNPALPGATQRTYIIPLWLLAAVSLAWPVTSFILARRRPRSRGFEVQAEGGSAVSTADS